MASGVAVERKLILPKKACNLTPLVVEGGVESTSEVEVRRVLGRFQIDGECRSIAPLRVGHINETLVSEWASSAGVRRFVHQRVNGTVFPDVPRLMDNVSRIVAHLAKKPRRDGDEVLELVPARDGRCYLIDEHGSVWRTYREIGNTETFNVIPNREVAFEAARAFGQFQADLLDFPSRELFEVIPGFHDTPRRFQAFEQAFSENRAGRAESVAKEREFILARRTSMGVLMAGLHDGSIPWRVTHNDTKVNNVLFSKTSHRAICVVDLDICMPGSSLFDFGDMARNAIATAAEDETDLSKVGINLDLFDALVGGHLASTGQFLLPREIDLLAGATGIIALELGMRFLGDFLNGDVYFGIQRPLHNLDRARTQLRLCEVIEGQMSAMQAVVERHRASAGTPPARPHR